MNDLYISPAAQKDLTEIKEYIGAELENPQAAQAVVTRITKTIRRLRDHAWIGTPLASVADINSDYRYLTSGNYLIFYRAVGGAVFVDRVLYGRRDYMRILFGDADKEMTE